MKNIFFFAPLILLWSCSDMHNQNNDTIDYKIVRENEKSAMLSFYLGEDDNKKAINYISINIDFNAKNYPFWHSPLERNLAQKHYSVNDLVKNIDSDTGLNTLQIIKDEHQSAYFFFKGDIDIQALDFSQSVAACSYEATDALCSTTMLYQGENIALEYQKRHLINIEKIIADVEHILAHYFSL